MSTHTVIVELVSTTCCECGVIFGMPRALYDQCKNYGDTHYCPHGHSQYFAEPENKRLVRLLAAADQKLATARAAERAAERATSAQKGIVTRLKNKAAKGKCPCCDVVFVNLASHMKNKHPEFEQREEPPCE